jgi:hypothetical protein
MSYYLLLITYYQAGEARAARGIVAEPPKRGRSHREGDGADSPTRGAKPRSGSPNYIATGAEIAACGL